MMRKLRHLRVPVKQVGGLTFDMALTIMPGHIVPCKTFVNSWK